MSTKTLDPVLITGCGVISPAGVGLDKLAELLAAGTGGSTELIAEDAAAFPPVEVRTVPQVKVADYVGRKGTRRLDRMVGFGLIATTTAMTSAGRGEREADRELRESTGVAVGTSTGSVRSVWELASSAYEPELSYVPSRFPNSVMNSCAGQIAIWNSFKAANATLASGHVSSISAIRYAANAIRWGQARSVVVGGVEELSPHLAWGWTRSGALAKDAVLGEGAAMLVTESRESAAGRPVLAEIVAAEVAYVGPGNSLIGGTGLAGGLTRCVTRALARSGTSPEQVGVVSLGAGGQRGVRAIEHLAVRRALGAMPAQVRVADVVGDCYSAAGALQSAAVLARWSGDAAPADETHALVTSIGVDGNVGCLLLRRPTTEGAS